MGIGKLVANACSRLFNMRGHARQPRTGEIEIAWAERGELVSVSGVFRNVSDSGAGVICAQAFKPGATVYVGPVGNSRPACVRHCRRAGDYFVVGLEFVRTRQAVAEPPPSEPVRLKYV